MIRDDTKDSKDDVRIEPWHGMARADGARLSDFVEAYDTAMEPIRDLEAPR